MLTAWAGIEPTTFWLRDDRTPSQPQCVSNVNNDHEQTQYDLLNSPHLKKGCHVIDIHTLKHSPLIGSLSTHITCYSVNREQHEQQEA